MSDASTVDVKPQDAPSSGVEPAAPPPAPPADSSAPSSSAPDATSPSSGDSRQSDRDGLLAAVRTVVETKPEPQALPSDDDEEPLAAEQPSQDQEAAGTGTPEPDVQPQAEPEPETEPPDPTEAELKKLRPETRRRFERLLQQRNTARQQLEAVQPQLAEYQQLHGYLQANQLSPEDTNNLLGIGAAMRRGDYQAFLNAVTPYVLAAQERLGLRISQDLQQQVDEGLIDEATARELTRTRHRAAEAESRLGDATRTMVSAQADQQLNAIRTAVDTWEANIQKRDPDYAQMAGAVRRYAQGLLQERGQMPTTPQEAVALTQTAYDEVRATFGRVRPALKPTRATPSGIHVATGAPNGAEPRTMKEAAIIALAKMRRAS